VRGIWVGAGDQLAKMAALLEQVLRVPLATGGKRRNLLVSDMNPFDLRSESVSPLRLSPTMP
jgi:hypothetical protein